MYRRSSTSAPGPRGLLTPRTGFACWSSPSVYPGFKGFHRMASNGTLGRYPRRPSVTRHAVHDGAIDPGSTVGGRVLFSWVSWLRRAGGFSVDGLTHNPAYLDVGY